MKVIFAGTPEFAVPTLRALLQSEHDIVAVYTQPDRPAGRGQKLRQSPVKELALANGVTVMQPERLKSDDELACLRAFDADIMVVVAYGLILPQAVLDIPRLGCLNIHASLLPRWRGAAPIQRALEAGDAETGVTIMQIEPKLDAGPMYHLARCPILPTDTAASLHDRLALLGAETLAGCLNAIADGSLSAERQDDALVTYAAKLEKPEAAIDWTQPAVAIDRRVRAFNPWPVAETSCRGQTLRIWLAEPVPTDHGGMPGSIRLVGRDPVVATGEGGLRLLEVQAPGGRKLPASAWANAQQFDGLVLGATA